MATKPALKPVNPAKGKATATPEGGNEAAVPKKKNRGKGLVIGTILFLVLGAGGGGAWYFLNGSGSTPKQEAGTEKEKKPPVFVPLEAFTVNLTGEGDHYLQVGIVLQAVDEAAVDDIKQQMPLIRNRLLLLLSAKTATELVTPEGKQKLSNQILSESRQSLTGKAPDRGVQNVLFASFVIQ
jgi:flagellar FliL protein